MNVEIRTRGFSLTQGLRAYVERRLQFAVGAVSRAVRHVMVILSDENGPRGGEDKRCLVSISLDGQRTLVLTEKGTDVYGAIDRATDRAAHTTRRQLQRLHHVRTRAKPAWA